MDSNAVFDLREHTIERVRGVGNVEFGIPLIGEES